MKHFARGRTAATVGAAVLATLLGAIVAHLVEAAPVIAGECEATYGVDLGPFFTGWFVGDLGGDTETTTFVFQSARTAAWVNNFGLQNPATHDITRVEMNVAVDAATVVLDGLEQGRIV
ncbi:hypothetical protein RBB84_03970 [Rhodococcus sp. D-6]|uniref:Uncharacterized protein n=1 Tax=Rhodococcus sp. D-6 TaxID=1387842 RepID=A0AAU7UZ82_9NOCA|nr:hypothetical protein [Rhodococcus sp. HS-D2]